jgi:transposase
MLSIPNRLESSVGKTGGITMQELERAKVVEALVAGEIKPGVAAVRLQITTRQVRRLKKQFERAGLPGLVSARRGRPGNRQLAPGTAQLALQIVSEHYADFGPTLACEKLRERHGLIISKETVRGLMIEAGLWTPRSERRAVLHQPRDRRACLGELVQIDGSRHPWFEQRGAECTLLVFVDDATGRLLQLHFAETESTASYFEATRRYLERHGKPQAFYSDQAAVFRSASKNRREPTQFQRALDELGVALVCANSPQAKGRVERMNRSLQDRLVKELRAERISTIEAANAWSSQFIDDYNQRFAYAARSALNLHTPVRKQENLALILAHREVRKLSSKLALKYYDRLFLFADSLAMRALIGQAIAIHTYANGQIELRADGEPLAHRCLHLPPRAAGPIDVDGKSVQHEVDQLTSRKKKRNRPHRHNPSSAEVAEGVVAAKKMAAARTTRARLG